MTTVYEVKTEKQEIEVEVSRKLVSRTCDWCGGAQTTLGQPMRHFIDGKVKITLLYSNYGTDGGNDEGWEIEDLCLDCAAKLRTLLEANGIKITDFDRSW